MNTIATAPIVIKAAPYAAAAAPFLPFAGQIAVTATAAVMVWDVTKLGVTVIHDKRHPDNKWRVTVDKTDWTKSRKIGYFLDRGVSYTIGTVMVGSSAVPLIFLSAPGVVALAAVELVIFIPELGWVVLKSGNDLKKVATYFPWLYLHKDSTDEDAEKAFKEFMPYTYKVGQVTNGVYQVIDTPRKVLYRPGQDLRHGRRTIKRLGRKVKVVVPPVEETVAKLTDLLKANPQEVTDLLKEQGWDVTAIDTPDDGEQNPA